MEKKQKQKYDWIKFTFLGYRWILQITVWIFEALLILNTVWYGDFNFFVYSKLINNIILAYAFMNYAMYLMICVVLYFYMNRIKNQLTDSEIIEKIQNQINDNSFTDSRIQYECYHILKKEEKRNENYKYIESEDSPTKVITKSDSINYSFKSMRDISGNIYLKTLGYTNMKVDINIIVEMDEETKKDFEDVKKRFFADYKNNDEYFNKIIKHNYELKRVSDDYIVKVNGGKCAFFYNKIFFCIISILGFAEILKIILNCIINRGTQTINIKKIISSKYDVNDPNVIQMFGYDRLSTNFYLNDNLYNNNQEIKGNDELLERNEKLLP